MEFAAGYQEPENGENFSEIVADYRDSISEVYFACAGTPSGRAALGKRGDAEASQRHLEEELAAIRSMGIRLDLLYNANCYGAEAAGSALESRICMNLDALGSLGLLPEIVTTTSPFAAHVIRKHFPGTEIRASVNMKLDSTLAMEYLSDLFDSFYLRRDLQRDLETVKLFSEWCRKHRKKLCMLANSGCLRNCPWQTFHDNLVAHDAEIPAECKSPDFIPHLCWNLYRSEDCLEEFLRSSWIRPEDLEHYEHYVDVVKLATRTNTNPRMVIGAYSRKRFQGNLLNLTEPNFSTAYPSVVLDNTRFPADWFQRAGACASNCRHCGKCGEVLKQVMIHTETAF